MTLIYEQEKGILMDLLTRRLQQKWSRGTARNPWGLEERWNKHTKSKRENIFLPDLR